LVWQTVKKLGSRMGQLWESKMVAELEFGWVLQKDFVRVFQKAIQRAYWKENR
jgi:hypothetical protein